ncbi:MAG TPA: hypothetical protein VM299_05425 [Solirubrobacteraceae bacterium]|jgi:hypothetical protein|nr:hypothetical protein [Solirubrobacteraceae bacterium]
MRLGKRRAKSAAEPTGATAPTVAEPVAATWEPAGSLPADSAPEPVIDAEAIELPPDDGAGATYASAAGEPAGAPPRGDGGAAGPPWPQPVVELAEQRPEAVVGAAFVGGLLLAAILRRLGR